MAFGRSSAGSVGFALERVCVCSASAAVCLCLGVCGPQSFAHFQGAWRERRERGKGKQANEWREGGGAGLSISIAWDKFS